jgi:hypothetical protein
MCSDVRHEEREAAAAARHLLQASAAQVRKAAAVRERKGAVGAKGMAPTGAKGMAPTPPPPKGTAGPFQSPSSFTGASTYSFSFLRRPALVAVPMELTRAKAVVVVRMVSHGCIIKLSIHRHGNKFLLIFLSLKSHFPLITAPIVIVILQGF